MKITSTELIQKLQADTRRIIVQLKQLQQEDPQVLLTQPAPGKWSVAQVVEHLNTYGRYYLPLIAKKLEDNHSKPNPIFSQGLLGGYFTKMMLPKAGKVVNKMSAPKNHSPLNDMDSKTVLDEFLEQERQMLELLEKGSNVDLNKIRIPISIAPMIRLKLGDTFGFLIAHHQRHFVQIENTLASVKQGAVQFQFS